MAVELLKTQSGSQYTDHCDINIPMLLLAATRLTENWLGVVIKTVCPTCHSFHQLSCWALVLPAENTVDITASDKPNPLSQNPACDPCDLPST